jgi:hypothetical protein
MRLIQVLSFGLLILLPANTFAGPAEDASAVQTAGNIIAELHRGGLHYHYVQIRFSVGTPP